ncbi:MAG: polysaccharide deacetylase family protein [Alphaproteobacteria bacterium]
MAPPLPTEPAGSSSNSEPAGSSSNSEPAGSSSNSEPAGSPSSDPRSDPWAALTEELDNWAAAHRQATFWWRDDDAALATAPLAQLIALAVRTEVPLALAVIPKNMAEDLGTCLAGASGVSVIQHGFAHINHARQKGRGAWELGADRPPATVFADLTSGYEILHRTFANRFVPLLVPPWNRIDAAITKGLPAVGIHALSTFGPRRAAAPAPGVIQINAHCDPVKWKGGAHFTGTARAIDDLVGHLRDRRMGSADADEPTGLLTHHLELDADCWAFVEAALTHIASHSAARWLSIAALVPGGAP